MGFVVDEDRGSLPYRLIHGEALVAAAAWAMGEAGVDLVDVTVPWHVIAEPRPGRWCCTTRCAR